MYNIGICFSLLALVNLYFYEEKVIRKFVTTSALNKQVDTPLLKKE